MTIHLSMTVRVLALATSLVVLTGCCRSIDSNPVRPDHVRGWVESPKEKSIGEFFLRKGESINNGRVAIELEDTIQPKSCHGTESTTAGAVLRFYRVADRQEILKMNMTRANTRLISFSPVLVNEYGIDTVSIRQINTADKWVWFELLK